MKPDSLLIGRKKEIQKLDHIVKSKKSEFLAVYGRRRIGKTFLIREYFDYKFDFQVSGLANANTKQQLFNFDSALRKQSALVFEKPSANWLVAFQRLTEHLECIKKEGRKVIFFDELSWFDTHNADFVMGLEHFWNSWVSNRKDVLLIVCGSAASWMVNELFNNSGGLHNRITQKMKIEPFNLEETEAMLSAKNCVFDRYQIAQLYMVMGGIPYYLDAVQPHLSAPQNIQELFFEKSGLLRNEFFNLYRSLFRRYKLYEQLVEILSSKTEGLQRRDIIKLSGITSGGTLTKVLSDLEESGFITSYTAPDNKKKDTTYRLSDFYTAFFFRFIKDGKYLGENAWLNLIDHPAQRAWQGYAFEQICLDHVRQIKKALGISGVLSANSSWRGSSEGKSAQIDLLIDRRDQVINVCECKFSLAEFAIDKDYAENLRSKIHLFKTVTRTKKAVYLTMITTCGIAKNKYAGLVQNEVVLDDLFN
ncbi:MAG TPA: ATP-binding protein [Flavilitoribacter sp.]|nr:ATP-binding protein [Flavilitoribacter sp.]HMQ89807.1 ATP-binding protein [Flavilitoribacter sp.]